MNVRKRREAKTDLVVMERSATEVGLPRNHHFIPVFYLRQWHDGVGQLYEHKKVYGDRIVRKPVSAIATGFQRDLYAFPELGPEGFDQHLESKFFQIVDDEGAKALHRFLMRDPSPWTAEARSGWSRFLLSLKVRHPDAMEELRRAIPRLWGRSYPPSQVEYERLRKPGDPESFEAFLKRRDPNIVHKITINMIMRAIEVVEVGTHINGMKWKVFDLPKSRHEFLISDRPAHYWRIKDSDGFISLPISPRKLFVAANTDHVFQRLMLADQTRVVGEVNKKVVSQARRFAYTRSASENQPLIERFFGVAQESRPLFPFEVD
ncbi:DUF4238 domain-containing protein [Bradyrhizobium ottawaense]|uniref:DUF4238 domain-containing protein n=1 Tax=Bradyrhizobium ottawaense TaxID=931866 RepID=UPI003FA0EFCB